MCQEKNEDSFGVGRISPSLYQSGATWREVGSWKVSERGCNTHFREELEELIEMGSWENLALMNS
jgi:hypothetical protein